MQVNHKSIKMADTHILSFCKIWLRKLSQQTPYTSRLHNFNKRLNIKSNFYSVKAYTNYSLLNVSNFFLFKEKRQSRTSLMLQLWNLTKKRVLTQNFPLYPQTLPLILILFLLQSIEGMKITSDLSCSPSSHRLSGKTDHVL